MSSLDYPASVQQLILHLKALPGVGPRSAERMALWLLGSGRDSGAALAQALRQSEQEVLFCEQCGFFSESVLCPACADGTREQAKICVVEQAADIIPLERCGVYHGLYHCLGGKLSPLNDVEPEDLRIDGLLERVRRHPGTEVILALGSDVEGEATAHYLTHLLKGLDCKVTRLAQGLPAGAGLGYADALTLSRAFSGRVSAE